MAKINKEMFFDRLNSKFSDEYKLLSEYNNYTSKIKVEHTKCGNIFETIPQYLCRGWGCKKCGAKLAGDKMRGKSRPQVSKAFTKTTEQYKREVFDKFGDEFSIIGEYIRCDKPIEILHKKCNKIFKMQPRGLLYSGDGCPHCTQGQTSNAEKELQKLLEMNNINITRRYKIPFDGVPSRYEFDVLLNDFNIGIEYDGLYYHSCELSKMTLLEKNNLIYKNSDFKNIIHIFSDEWKHGYTYILKRILNFTKNNKIDKHNLSVKKITEKEAKEFIPKYFLKAFKNDNFYGIFNDNFIGIFILNKNNSEIKYFDLDFMQFDIFEKVLELLKINNILINIDIRYEVLYKNIISNLNLKYKTEPILYYTKSEVRYNKNEVIEKIKKKYNIDISNNYDSLFNNYNYNSIWDCGNLVYEWKRKDD